MLKNRPQAILIYASQREIAHNNSMVPNNSTNEHPWERVGHVGEREREREEGGGRETKGQAREDKEGRSEREWVGWERRDKSEWGKEKWVTEGLRC